MTHADDELRSRGTFIDPNADTADADGAERTRYAVPPQADGGVWRGPTEAAWTTRILRGTLPPRQPTGKPTAGSDPRP